MSQNSDSNAVVPEPKSDAGSSIVEKRGAEVASVSGNNSSDAKKQQRESLRSKYEQFLKEAKGADTSARHEEALERLKKEPGAEMFNLVSRMKGDQRTGLIILNRAITKSLPVREPVKTPEPAKNDPEEISDDPPEPPKRTRTVKKVPKEPDTPTQTVSKRAARKTEPAAPRKAPRPSSKKEASEALVMGLSNKVDALWRKLEHMKAKKKEKRLNKEARKSMKELVRREIEDQAPPGPKESFYDRLDQSSNTGPSLVNSEFLLSNLW